MDADHAVMVLASASPRRRDLLSYLEVPFLAVSNNGEEETTPVPEGVLAALPACPVDQATHPSLLAWRKAYTARQEGHTRPILGADTIVVLDNRVLGKPRDEAHAVQLLSALAGRQHTVYTGLALLPGGGAAVLFDLVRSDVELAPLTDQEIRAYIATGEPMDKAGAYGIQGLGGRLVQQVHGSFTNVVGLPLQATADLLAQAGITVPVAVEAAWNRWRQTLSKEGPCINPSRY